MSFLRTIENMGLLLKISFPYKKSGLHLPKECLLLNFLYQYEKLALSLLLTLITAE